MNVCKIDHGVGHIFAHLQVVVELREEKQSPFLLCLSNHQGSDKFVFCQPILSSHTVFLPFSPDWQYLSKMEKSFAV